MNSLYYHKYFQDFHYCLIPTTIIIINKAKKFLLLRKKKYKKYVN
jgi:hypothetical protein